jgi:pilus assembly protein CpaB
MMALVRAQAQKKLEMEKVVVAKKDIPRGVSIEERMVTFKEVPIDYIQPRAARSIGRVVDKIAIAPISKGEQILLNKLTTSTQDFSSLSYRTPPGKRAILIPVDDVSSVGGMIKPDDYVDILGVIPQTQEIEGEKVTQYFTVPLFQKVLVLAVGRETVTSRTGTKKSGSGVKSITVALSPQEATLIAFVQEHGKIRFILRSPEDKDVVQVEPASWETLFKYLFPNYKLQKVEPEPKEEKKEVKKPSTPEVEIYRGTQKEVVPLLY